MSPRRRRRCGRRCSRAPRRRQKPRGRCSRRARRALEQAPAGRSGVTIYGVVGHAGRLERPTLRHSASIRLRGPAALFMAPGPIGPRLIHAEPIAVGGTPTARAGTIAVERVLGRHRGLSHWRHRRGHGSKRASFRSRCAAATRAPADSPQPYRFLVARLRTVVPCSKRRSIPADLAALRARYRAARASSLALAVLAGAMLVVAVPVEEWRRRRRTPGELAIASGGARRADADGAHPAVGRTPAPGCGPTVPARESALLRALFFRSPLDLLATGGAAAGDRGARGRPARAPPAAGSSPSRAGRNGSLHRRRSPALTWRAGVALAAVLLAHHALMARLLEHASVNPVQFSLHPLEPARMAFVLARAGDSCRRVLGAPC